MASRFFTISSVFLIFFSIVIRFSITNGERQNVHKRQMGMGMGMDMSMGMGMGMSMNLPNLPNLPSPPPANSLTSMSNPLTLQMPYAPNPFYNTMYPTRRHQLSLDGNGQDFLDQPLNPYEKVLNSKYPTSPFERLFGKSGPMAAPAVSSVLTSYQTNNNNNNGGGGGGSGFDDQSSGGGGGGYMGSYSGAYESGDFGAQFGRRSSSSSVVGKSKKFLRLRAVRSDVYYRNEAYADYFEL